MNILVTGGAGFIGSALARRLSAEGHMVVVVDSFTSYYDVQLKRDRVATLIPHVPVYFVDVTESGALAAIFREYDFDVVCHLAAQAGVRYSVEAPETYVQSNVLGTQSVLEVMQRRGVRRLVFASTSSAYGTTTPVPFTEDAAADRPVSVYAATKRAGELLAHTYYEQYGIECTCLRFFTVYGPWSRPDMAMLKFTERMLAGQPIEVYNNGDLRRDFTYIDDIIDGFVRAVYRPLGYRILNLGNGSPVELLQFINVLEAAFEVTATKRWLPMQQGDVYETYADISAARTELGYQPSTSLVEGVKAFADWYRSYRLTSAATMDV